MLKWFEMSVFLKTLKKTFSALILSAGVFIFLGTLHSSLAQPMGGCDPEFLEAMDKRAWMEGEREMEAAQTIIKKQASILQYSCFLNQLPSAASLWSNSWPSINPIRKTNMSQKLGSVVAGPAQAYLRNNFAYSGLCESMYDAWQESKCADFDKGNFWEFKDLVGFDPRQFPLECPAQEARTERWTDAMRIAYPAPGGAGGLDPLNPYMKLIEGPCNETPIVKTGVLVSGTIDEDPVEETFCIPPGCVAGPGADECG